MTRFIPILLLLLASQASAIEVRVLPGGTSDFLSPIIVGNTARFDDFRPGTSGVDEFGLAVIRLAVTPGIWRVNLEGESNGTGNASWLLVDASPDVANQITFDSGTWTQTLDFTAAMLAADFNGDGLVDAADYTVWRNAGQDRTQYDLWKADYDHAMLSIAEITVAGQGIGQLPPSLGVTRFSITRLSDSLPVPELDSRVYAGLLLPLMLWRLRRW